MPRTRRAGRRIQLRRLIKKYHRSESSFDPKVFKTPLASNSPRKPRPIIIDDIQGHLIKVPDKNTTLNQTIPPIPYIPRFMNNHKPTSIDYIPTPIPKVSRNQEPISLKSQNQTQVKEIPYAQIKKITIEIPRTVCYPPKEIKGDPRYKVYVLRNKEKNYKSNPTPNPLVPVPPERDI